MDHRLHSYTPRVGKVLERTMRSVVYKRDSDERQKRRSGEQKTQTMQGNKVM